MGVGKHEAYSCSARKGERLDKAVYERARSPLEKTTWGAELPPCATPASPTGMEGTRGWRGHGAVTAQGSALQGAGEGHR